MTEKEWLEQSDEKKSVFIREILDIPDLGIDLLSWVGFGMIVEKFGSLKFTLTQPEFGKKYLIRLHSVCVVRLEAYADTPWEAAALSYGKMKGLIE